MKRGYTLIELLIATAIIAVIASIIATVFIDNRGATESRALENAQKFIADNNIEAKRLTCAGDSDGDGYGTCNLVTASGEKVILNCPTNWGDVNLFGATGCKEIFINMGMELR